MAHTVCGACFSLGCSHFPKWSHALGPLLGGTFWEWPNSVYGICISLNKSTSYLLLCLPLNFFCAETQRNWASVSPDTRWVILIKRPWVQVPIWVLAGFESWPVGSSPNLRYVVSLSPEKRENVKAGKAASVISFHWSRWPCFIWMTRTKPQCPNQR